MHVQFRCYPIEYHHPLSSSRSLPHYISFYNVILHSIILSKKNLHHTCRTHWGNYLCFVFRLYSLIVKFEVSYLPVCLMPQKSFPIRVAQGIFHLYRCLFSALVTHSSLIFRSSSIHSFLACFYHFFSKKYQKLDYL